MAKDLLFEIGTEEIPASEMTAALPQLVENAASKLKENRLTYEDIRTMGTPRRTVLYVKGLSEEQESFAEEVRGPAGRIAFAEDGNPTPAAIGFARSQGVKAEDLILKETTQGEYVFAVKRATPKKADEILPGLLKDLVLSIDYPKAMRWGDRDLKFARPIRWLLCLYGTKTLKIELDGVLSAKKTFGHRTDDDKPVEVKKASDYLDELGKHNVVVDQEKRRELIIKEIKEAAKSVAGEPVINPAVLEEVVYLVEAPYAVAGAFEQEYLDLPRCVTVTAMESHQRYFPVENTKAELMPYFIVVHNGSKAHDDLIRTGHERVLRARLADALFFFREDRKKRLEDSTEALKGVLFQERLGSVYDKVLRMEALTETICNELGLKEDVKSNAKRAAMLAKSDLVTDMVREFPALQGAMGGEYAALDGEDIAVVSAITEHYKPRSYEDGTPQSETGMVLSIADKLDTLVGLFGINMIPTGSQDPYALRRQAQGIVSIIIDNRLPVKMKTLVSKAIDQYVSQGCRLRETGEIQKDVDLFLAQRVKFHIQKEKVRYDIADAVLTEEMDDLVAMNEKAIELNKVLGSKAMEDLLTGFERCNNLSRNAASDMIEPVYFEADIESKLYEELIAADDALDKTLAAHDIAASVKTLASLRPTIDTFFDDVLVMDKNEAKRTNRLALLKRAVNVFNRLADFSKVVREGER